MRRFSDDDSGQLILIACLFVVLSLMLMTTYEYSALGTGEKSINRENINSYYYYDSIREKYINISQDPNNITFENDLKAFALLHGYSVDFVCKGRNTTIIFIDKDIQIMEDSGVKC